MQHAGRGEIEKPQPGALPARAQLGVLAVEEEVGVEHPAPLEGGEPRQERARREKRHFARRVPAAIVALVLAPVVAERPPGHVAAPGRPQASDIVPQQDPGRHGCHLGVPGQMHNEARDRVRLDHAVVVEQQDELGPRLRAKEPLQRQVVGRSEAHVASRLQQLDLGELPGQRAAGLGMSGVDHQDAERRL